MSLESNQKKLRLVTRKSQLAMYQANFIKQKLMTQHQGLDVEIIGVTTQGDKILDKTLSKIGGKGLFLKELQYALLDNQADFAVHCLKDIPAGETEGLRLIGYCQREESRDCLVSNKVSSLAELAPGAIVGTSSLRRQALIKNHHPELIIKPLRGNVNTRLAKLDSGDYDAIILAAVGLQRLGLSDRIKHIFSHSELLPAVGQGALVLESRVDDNITQSYCDFLNHHDTYLCVSAECAMNVRLNGSCQVPIAGYAHLENDKIHLTGIVAEIDGSLIHEKTASANINDAVELGQFVAESLLSAGADQILKKYE